MIANAMVTGLTPWIRYVILTDRLIDELTPDEIEAVFGHEVGHIRHYHLIFYLAFFMTSFIMLGLAWEAVGGTSRRKRSKSPSARYPMSAKHCGPRPARKSGKRCALKSFGKLFLIAGYTLLVFGYLSRRCERQADLYGAQAVSTEVFVNALEKVAYINGIPRERRQLAALLATSHHRPRVDFLREMQDHPERIRRFHVSIGLMQVALAYSLALMLWWFQLPRVDVVGGVLTNSFSVRAGSCDRSISNENMVGFFSRTAERHRFYLSSVLAVSCPNRKSRADGIKSW